MTRSDCNPTVLPFCAREGSIDPAFATRLCAAVLLTAVVALIPTRRGAGEAADNWQPTQKNQPSFCAKLWRGVGRPSVADKRDVTFVCHTKFVLSHNNRAKTPDWVIERLDKKGVSGPLSRPDQSFVQEKLVPRRGRASDDDYTKAPSNLARGHLAPSEDFNINENLMRETFILSNAVPQVDDRFNASIWKRLEEEVRDAAKARGKVDVITGPVRAKGNSRSRTITKAENACGHEIVLASPTDELICEARNKKTVSSCPTGVTVPIAVYKIVYDRSGGGAAYAFVMPNRDHDSHTGNAALTYLEGFRTPVAVIENLTGMKFFLNLKGEKRKRVVQRCAPGTLWRTEP